jgi:hypothetical protein
MNISNPLPSLHQALANDQKIDAKEWTLVQADILQDGKISSQESQMVTDALTRGQFDQDVVPSVISWIAEALKAPAAVLTGGPAVPTGDSSPTAAAQPAAPKATVAAPVAQAVEPAKVSTSPWKTEYAIQGNLNHTSVSSGWEGQYGQEKTATKIEGSFQADVNYDGKRNTWKNRLRVEYGNTFVDGEEKRAVSRNNLELTSELGHKLIEKDKIKIEVPYASIYTQGPLTELEGRKFRETTGAKITYTDEKIGEYSVKVGAGFQQQHAAATGWSNEAGVEMVIEGKQRLSFMKKPVAAMVGTKEENVAFLDRLEGQVQVNAFNPLQNGISAANTDLTVRVSGRYYINDTKSVWVGATQQWEYGGKADSTMESKFSADLGFKFN